MELKKKKTILNNLLDILRILSLKCGSWTIFLKWWIIMRMNSILYLVLSFKETCSKQ